jgi:hypothetical protein
MIGIALVTLVAAIALVSSVRAVRQRRRAPRQRPLVLARAGGRAFAAHLGTLSDVHVGLEIPSVHGAWRRLGSLASSR